MWRVKVRFLFFLPTRVLVMLGYSMRELPAVPLVSSALCAILKFKDTSRKRRFSATRSGCGEGRRRGRHAALCWRRTHRLG